MVTYGHADNSHTNKLKPFGMGYCQDKGTPVHTTSKPSQKIWTPRLAANWLSGKFMIQLDTGENQVSG